PLNCTINRVADPQSRGRRRCIGFFRPVTDLRSAGSCALGCSIHGIERLTRRHEQSIPLRPPEANIATDLRQTDAADELPSWVPHSHAIIPDFAPGIAGAPDVAVDVAAHPVRATLNAIDDAIGKQFLIRQFLVRRDVEDEYDALAPRPAVPGPLTRADD